MSPHFAVVQYEMYVLLSRKMLLFGMFLAQQTLSHPLSGPLQTFVCR